MLTQYEKQLRKDVKKHLFPNITPKDFEDLRRMYYACAYIRNYKNETSLQWHSEYLFGHLLNILGEAYTSSLDRYKELKNTMETIEHKCCKDLYCMNFLNTQDFKYAFNKFENGLLNRINKFQADPWDIRRPEFTPSICCFILYLHPDLDIKIILELEQLINLTTDMRHAIEQGKEHTKKRQEQIERQNKFLQNQSYKTHKPGSRIILDPNTLNSNLMQNRRIK